MDLLLPALIIAGVAGDPGKEDNVNAHFTPRDGRVVILSSVDMIKNRFVLSQADPVSNLHFFLDLLEVLSMDPRLLQLGTEQDESKRSNLFRQIFKAIPGAFLVRYYASEARPPPIKDLRTQTLAVLEELKALSDGRLGWEITDPSMQASELAEKQVKEYFETKEKGMTPTEPKLSLKALLEDRLAGKKQKTDAEVAEERKKKAEENARASGKSIQICFRELLKDEFEAAFLGELELRHIREISYQGPERGGQRVSYEFYSSLEVAQNGKAPEVIPRHYRVQGMDYKIARCILKLVRTAKPKVMFFDGRKRIPNPHSSPEASASLEDPDGFMVPWLAEQFEVEEVVLKEGISLDDVLWTRTEAGKEAKASCFVVLQPEDLEERQVYEISRAVSEGIPTIFLVSRWSIDASEKGRQGGYPLRAIHPGIDELFRSWGIKLGNDILASRECSVAPQQLAPASSPIGPASPRLPILLKTLAPSLRAQYPRDPVRQFLLFPATVGLDIDSDKVKAAGLRLTELANSGAYSYPVALPPAKDGTLSSVMTIKALSDSNAQKTGFTEPRPLAVLIEGKLPFLFEGHSVPSWKKAP